MAVTSVKVLGMMLLRGMHEAVLGPTYLVVLPSVSSSTNMRQHSQRSRYELSACSGVALQHSTQTPSRWILNSESV